MSRDDDLSWEERYGVLNPHNQRGADSIIPLDQIDAFHAAWNAEREKLILEGDQGLRERDISMAHKGFRAGWLARSGYLSEGP